MPDYIIYVIKHKTTPNHGHLYYTLSVTTAENTPIIPTKIESESDSQYDYENSEAEAEAEAKAETNPDHLESKNNTPLETPREPFKEKADDILEYILNGGETSVEPKVSPIKEVILPKKPLAPKKVVLTMTEKEKEAKRIKEEKKKKKEERLKAKLNSVYVAPNNIDKRSTLWKFEELKRDCQDPSCYNYHSEICQEMRKDINSWELVKLQVVSGLNYKQEIAKEVLRQRKERGYTLRKYNELLGETFGEFCKHYIKKSDCSVCKYTCKHCRRVNDCIFCTDNDKEKLKEEKELNVVAEINKIKMKLRELSNENKELLKQNENLTLEIKRLTEELKEEAKRELKEEITAKKEAAKLKRQEREDAKLRKLHLERLRKEKEDKWKII